MRRVGRIFDWNDEKGFGFVVPHDGGARAFVHIKAFKIGSRRPIDGDLVSYEPMEDSKGRINAASIRFAGQKIEAPKRPWLVPRLPVAFGFLVLLLIGFATGRVPGLLVVAYVLLSLTSYVMYWLDKVAATKAFRRTPEANLHLMDLLGGWPGGLVAQHQFRHKTAKVTFQSAFWLTVVVNLAAAAWLVMDDRVLRVVKDLVDG